MSADALFVAATDTRLRNDLTLLVDEKIVLLPLNEWPLARQDVAAAVAGIDVADVEKPALRSALARVKAATLRRADAAEWKLREVRLTAGQPGLLRDDETMGRENAELTAVGGASTDRFGITLAATGAVDASDRKDWRFDGSSIAVRWGNWLLGVNQLDRSWGPGRDGSLILSSNARPMPAVSLDRIRSLPVDLPVLRWLGPWRFSAFVGAGESHRADVDSPLFMGMRLSFKPAANFEFGLSRSAQFCGDGRRCDFATFGRMLIGQDNTGTRGLDDPDDEPGNQMSGLDLRIVSPLQAVPVAVYGQLIGEDNSDASLPIRFMYLGGLESWWTLGNGSVLRAHVEHADTSTGWYKLFRPDDPTPGFGSDYGYRNHIFFAGYRYRGRNIGHTTDADSETTSMELSLTTDRGDRWAASARYGLLDRKGAPDAYNPLTQGRSRYRSLQVSWNGVLGGQDLGLQLGHESQSPAAAGGTDGVFGFVHWRRVLD
ncbi:MAG: capsule assembly Wzi family protein [Steroidobacteraceae bacterium]